MEMHQIRYFLAVAEELNFTRAAERRNVAQPSLARAIKLLEEMLGGLLFHRERANTHLSELGRMVRPHLQQMMNDARQTKALAGSFKSLKRTRLPLGVMCTIVPTQMIELIGALRERHPGVELEILDATAKNLNDRLIGGEIDVGLYCFAEREVDERLHAIPLFREQMMIVLPPGHRLAERNAITPQDLNGEKYLERVNCEVAELACRIFEERGVVDETVYRSDRDDWIMAMAAAGMGYAFMPQSSVTHPGVVARPLIEPEIWRDVFLVTVRGRPHTPAVGALVREAMRVRWSGRPAIAVQSMSAAALSVAPASVEPDSV